MRAGRGDVVLTEDVGEYAEGETFKSFHHQARHPLSKKAVLAVFLSIWLKNVLFPQFQVKTFPRWQCFQQYNWYSSVHWVCY